MASSSRSTTHNSSSSSEPNLQEEPAMVADQKKMKRMASNRESARRSRMKKQKHLDDLTAQISQLRRDNNQMLTTIGATTQSYVNVEAENSVLRAQVMELTQRLDSLHEILNSMNASSPQNNNQGLGLSDGSWNSNNYPWDFVGINNHHQQPIAASSSVMFDY